LEEWFSDDGKTIKRHVIVSGMMIGRGNGRDQFGVVNQLLTQTLRNYH